MSVRTGKARSEILAAVFPLSRGGEVLFQLAREGVLPVGGVYLRSSSEEDARAPRFDEIFRDVAAKARVPRLARALRGLARKARTIARSTRPRLTPRALTGLTKLARDGSRLDTRHPECPGLPLEALALVLALIFASEEERYPRPRYRGCDVALERILDLAPGNHR